MSWSPYDSDALNRLLADLSAPYGPGMTAASDDTLDTLLAEMLGDVDLTVESIPRQRVVDIADRLRRLLDALDSGELVASPSTRLRVEGALVACRALVAGRSS